jgi:hypothetical protein
MRKSCTSGSVRGARGNSRPYRDTNARPKRAFGETHQPRPDHDGFRQ